MLKLLKRWRTSHGYGVHSTFAFNLITKVLREYDAHYYAYAEIDSLCPQGRRIGPTDNFSGFRYAIPDARLLFRLLCRFNPTQIVEVGYGHEVTNTIIERAVPKARRISWVTEREITYVPQGLSFVLINQFREGIHDLVKQMIVELAARPEGVIVFVRNLQHDIPTRNLWKDLTAVMTRGMDFTSRHVGLICSLQGLPRQSFSLNF